MFTGVLPPPQHGFLKHAHQTPVSLFHPIGYSHFPQRLHLCYPRDVLFLQDFTSSQGPYIDKARTEIGNICTLLLQKGNFVPGGLRFGVVAFRDHPPQDSTFVTNVLTPGSNPEQVAFVPDAGTVANVLNTLSARGGGDGPEAAADALQLSLTADWKDGASRVVILITDAPPHGVEETGDMFPDGCPLRK